MRPALTLPHSDDRLAPFVGWLALAVAFVVAVILPLGYFALTYRGLAGHAETEAEIYGNAIAALLGMLLGGLIYAALRRVTTALYKEKERYARLSRYANDAIFLIDAQGHIVEANERALERYGYSDAEMRTLHLKYVRAAEAQAEAQGISKACASVAARCTAPYTGAGMARTSRTR